MTVLKKEYIKPNVDVILDIVNVEWFRDINIHHVFSANVVITLTTEHNVVSLYFNIFSEQACLLTKQFSYLLSKKQIDR